MASHFAKMVVAKMLTTMVEIPKSVEMASKKKEKKNNGIRSCTKSKNTKMKRNPKGT
jgi:hypothetical protein